MFKVTNNLNKRFLNQYVRDLTIDKQEIQKLDGFSDFIRELKKVSLQSIDILGELTTDYLSQVPTGQLIETHSFDLSVDGNDKLPLSVQLSFDQLMLAIGRDKVGYSLSDYGRIDFNDKKFSECVMQLFSLVVNQSDPDTLLVYNKEKGYWEDAKQWNVNTLLNRKYKV